MLEKKLFKEIPGGKNSFHSAILTSFSFNFHHFEYQVLRSLRQKYISSISVLVDNNILDDVLGIASSSLKHISQSYSVVGMKSKGAFHPKVNFLIGDDKLLMFFGSGNITSGGHGKNHELFTGFYADNNDQTQLPLLIETWHYIQKLATDLDGYNSHLITAVLPKNNKYLVNELGIRHNFYKLNPSIDVALLYNEDTSIFEQLLSHIPKNEVTKITVICPYYDEDGETLINLRDHFDNSSIDAYLPIDFGLPPIKIINGNKINFFSWEATDRGKMEITGKNMYHRKLHSKIIHFETENFEFCLLGSSNLTNAGLGNLTKKPINQEFGALYKLKGKGILQLMGINGVKEAVSITNYSRSSNVLGDNPTSKTLKQIQIKNVDLTGITLKIYLRTKIDLTNAHLSIFNGNGDMVFSELFDTFNKDHGIIKLNLRVLTLNPVYVQFLDEKAAPLSNKQIINILDKLIHTEPTQGNRNIRQIINAIEGGKINEFEIIEYINNLTGSKTATTQLQQKNCSAKDNEITPEEMTYEEAIEASKKVQSHDQVISQHSSSRIWSYLRALFKTTSTIIEEELMDEEEEGNAQASRDRGPTQTENQPIQIKTQNDANSKIISIERLVRNYIESLRTVTMTSDHKIGIIDLSHFLLISHILTVLCCFTEYEKDEKSNDKDLNITDWNSKLAKLYEALMTEVLANFTKMCIQNTIIGYSEDEYNKDKMATLLEEAINHSFVYLYLLDRKCKEQTIKDKLELIGLNLLLFLRKPDDRFNEYVNNMSRAYLDEYFNASSVIRFKDKLMEKYNDPDLGAKYFTISYLGFCHKIEEKNRKTKFFSLYGPNNIWTTQIIKNKIIWHK